MQILVLVCGIRNFVVIKLSEELDDQPIIYC